MTALKEEILLVCDMRKPEDRELANSLRSPHRDLQISDQTGGDYARFCGQPTLFRKVVRLQGHEDIREAYVK